MPNIQNLKKQLRSIRSTGKITKAMKTISSIKFSKLSNICNAYSEYGRQCGELLSAIGLDAGKPANPEAPAALLIFGTNKGLCGNFNSSLFSFALQKCEEFESPFTMAFGKKTSAFLKSKSVNHHEYETNDMPALSDAKKILSQVLSLREQGVISSVYIVYSQYKNMLVQTPQIYNLFAAHSATDDSVLYVPNRETVSEKTYETLLCAVIYGFLLETATGAQAATLMSMRSACDTAEEYTENLEKEINRMRQSAVTADVLETFAERE